MFRPEEEPGGLSARELADLLEDACEGVCCVGADGSVLWANRADAELLGYGAGELVGMHVTELHADRDVLDDLFSRLSRNETIRNFPARLRCKDGSIKHVLISSNARFDETGRFIHARCFTRDITELVLLQAGRRPGGERAKSLLEPGDEQTGSAAPEPAENGHDVLALVSHDLRNPLGVIALKAEHVGAVLGSTPREQRLKDHVAAITRAAGQMERLIRDLTDYSSMQAGVLALEQRPHGVSLLAERAVAIAGMLPGQRQLEVDLGGHGDLRVHCDADRTLQVLSNLIGNAVKFTADHARIQLAVRRDGEMVRFEVHDDGVRLTEEQLPRLFDRNAPAPAGERRGLGLGLFVSKGIVEEQGGRIWAESQGETGAVFKFTVPICAGG
jgi:PAS domain S-box-containing protein